MGLSLKEIEMKLKSNEDMEECILLLKNDGRKGAQRLLQTFKRRQEKERQLENMHRQMTVYEQKLLENGSNMIAGIDEVGRGPLAGPVVACAVILPADFKLLGLTDSKKLSKAKREAFADHIKKEAVSYSISMVHAVEIDQMNIYQSTKKAMCQAIEKLQYEPDHLLVDAMTLPVVTNQTSIIKGDQKSISIAASSVLAKVARDRYMEELESQYPGYGFANHAGYGTKEHLEALEILGVTKEHRQSFKPITELLAT
ncbi:ribonuclease HII [Halalkalibacter sp. AB-rgal2]|uniref:ribonuclease HII n=1 Tax=Halalkalibacter sp. AB-rgal2 TaxID=3242695 RepID=UPI00359EA3E5